MKDSAKPDSGCTVEGLVGCLFRRMGQTHRVMAVCENYAMMRFEGGKPYVASLKDLQMEYFQISSPNDSLNLPRDERG
jgi:hypothetical protein